MRLRSLLFVPGDRPDRMEKACRSGADALILDLEDSVVLAKKDEARAEIAKFLRSCAGRSPESDAHDPGLLPAQEHLALFVRINPLDSGMAEADLAAILPASPDGIVLPKAEGAASVRRLAEHTGLPILPVATETAAAMFALGSYAEVAGSLAGLTWGAEDLPAAIGATTSREPDGSYTAPYQLARSLTLLGAHAAGVPAIETVYPDFRDLDGLKAYAERGYRDGFTGMMAIHPAQVPVINAAFSPGEAQIAHAQAVVAAFDANPDAGALNLDGRMIDAPHLKAARRTLGLA